MEQLEMEKNGLNNALAQRNAVIENAAIQLTKVAIFVYGANCFCPHSILRTIHD